MSPKPWSKEFMSKASIDAEVMPTLSGITHPDNSPAFSDYNPLYKSTFFASDAALTAKGSWLEREEEKLDMTRSLRELSRTEQYEKPLELVMSVPGIGQQVGMALLAEIVDIRRFKSAESLAKYVGLVPMCHGSGEKDGVGDITIRKDNTYRLRKWIQTL